jgi:hypothetical protein
MSNIVESPLAALRLRTDAAKRPERVASATAVIWKMLLVAESRFRQLNAPELTKRVYLGNRVPRRGRSHQEGGRCVSPVSTPVDNTSTNDQSALRLGYRDQVN